jgi:hypothetical protein
MISRSFVAFFAGVLSVSLAAEEGLRFPTVEGKTLEGRSVVFPRDFASPAALVFVAFQRRQQSDIDAWKPFVQKARASLLGLSVWELPMIGTGYSFMRGFIDGGMRSGIPDRAARESTATFYLDTKPVAEAIGAPDRGQISVLVVAPDGRILARASGRPMEASEGTIESALESAFGTPPSR